MAPMLDPGHRKVIQRKDELVWTAYVNPLGVGGLECRCAELVCLNLLMLREFARHCVGKNSKKFAQLTVRAVIVGKEQEVCTSHSQYV